ncbi:MAG: redoxin domain-containing protein [Chitinophagaceae bacterium]|nr:redoxin domain-containing protein [Chitinophagaceae bacterium]
MSSVKLKLVLKLILFFPFLMVSFYAFYVLKAYRLQQKRKALSSQAGRQFPSIPLKDVHGNAVSLDISGTRLTVIDFWYRNCVPCIVEMNQFEEHLKGKEQEIAVISISVDDAAAWKAAARVMTPGLLS